MQMFVAIFGRFVNASKYVQNFDSKEFEAFHNYHRNLMAASVLCLVNQNTLIQPLSIHLLRSFPPSFISSITQVILSRV